MSVPSPGPWTVWRIGDVYTVVGAHGDAEMVAELRNHIDRRDQIGHYRCPHCGRCG